ncbi:MAG: phosphopantetheine-binding protein [Pirellulaceae bacterium]|jgi:acyl carrier protein|nr:phosphopantetheine-binding protein [Pirellulaceae bacterium]
MNEVQIRETVLHVLGAIAPEADLSQLNPEARLRDQLDIDSMDFLNFVIGLHDELHVDIPEKDYGQLATLAGCVQYLIAAMGRPGSRRAE